MSRQRMKKGSANDKAKALLLWAVEHREAIETIRGMLNTKPAKEPWRGIAAVPPKSILDYVLGGFIEETDIPLELPFFAVLHFVSGLLMKHGSKITGKAGTVLPDIWNIVLSDSGAGKTLAHDIVAEQMPIKSEFPTVASGAKFIEALRDHNNGLWFQDEIAQFLRQVEQPGSPLADVKDYMLKAYSNSKIERATKKETITIEKPSFSLLGLNTPQSFGAAISAESLLDGFAQRFGFVMAQRDPARPWRAFPVYDRQKLAKRVGIGVRKLRKVKLHDTYTVGTEALEAFREAFDFTADGAGQGIAVSFYRRAMWRAWKYALCYHILLGKETPRIEAEDVGWAARVCQLHLADLRKVAALTAAGDVVEMAERATKTRRRMAGKGKTLTARALQQSMSGSGVTAAEASALVDIVT